MHISHVLSSFMLDRSVFKCVLNLYFVCNQDWGHTVVHLVEALLDVGSIPNGVTEIFH